MKKKRGNKMMMKTMSRRKRKEEEIQEERKENSITSLGTFSNKVRVIQLARDSALFHTPLQRPR